jgi:uncharacterized membrane protein
MYEAGDAGTGTFAAQWTASDGVRLLSMDSSSEADTVAGDGLSVFGTTENYTNAMLWAAGQQSSLGIPVTGTLPGPYSTAHVAAANADGSVMVGWTLDSQSQERAFRWSSGAGFDVFGTAGSRATRVSGDGSVVVGYRVSGGTAVAYRWTVGARTPEDLELLPGYPRCYVNGVSSDGLVTVGYCNDTGWNQHWVAVRWEDTAVFELGSLQTNAFTNWGVAANSDGSIILATGSGTGAGWLWDAVNGARSLSSVLAAANADVTGLDSAYVKAMSSDGKTVIGANTTGGAVVARLP